MKFLWKATREIRAKEIPPGFSEASMDLEGYLQQPLEDATIVGELSQLQRYIESHTLKFYHLEAVGNMADDVRARLEDEITKDIPSDAASLVSGLMNRQSRQMAIRTTIARILFTSIDFSGNPKRTLLPSETISLLSKFKLGARSPEWNEGAETPLLYRKTKLTQIKLSILRCRDGGSYQTS